MILPKLMHAWELQLSLQMDVKKSDGSPLEQQLLRSAPRCGVNRTYAQSLTSGPLQRALTRRQQHPPTLVLKTGSSHRKKHTSWVLLLHDC